MDEFDAPGDKFLARVLAFRPRRRRVPPARCPMGAAAARSRRRSRGAFRPCERCKTAWRRRTTVSLNDCSVDMIVCSSPAADADHCGCTRGAQPARRRRRSGFPIACLSLHRLQNENPHQNAVTLRQVILDPNTTGLLATDQKSSASIFSQIYLNPSESPKASDQTSRRAYRGARRRDRPHHAAAPAALFEEMPKQHRK